MIILLCCAPGASAQQSADLARLQAKYPGFSSVTVTESRKVTISLSRNGAPEIAFCDSTLRCILADNASVFSQGKEYFSSRFQLQKLEAYSLVPVKDSYKKAAVARFNRSREMDENVFYDDLDSYSFTFPLVGKGTRLVTVSDAVVNDPCYPIVFFFGGYLPTDESRFTVTMPANVQVRWHLYGTDTSNIQFTKAVKGKQVTLTWRASGLGSYASDDWSPARRYYAPHIILQIASYTSGETMHKVIGSLDDLYAWTYSKIAGVNVEPSDEVARLSDSLTAGKTGNKDKVRAIYQWVQDNIRYVAIEDGEEGYVPSQAFQVLQRRYGDCKDLTSILVALLRSAGMQADMAWIGTRSLPYRFTTFPSIANSNHMIAVWWETDTRVVILDGTSRFLGFDEIPSGLQGKQCLISKGPADYVTYDIPVSAPDDNTTTDTLWITLDQGVLKGNGHIVFTGDDKETPLASVTRADTNRYRDAVGHLIPWASNKLQCLKAQPSGLKATEGPFSIRYTFSLPDYVTSANSSVYVNLNLERDLMDIQLSADRKIPVEFDVPSIRRIVTILTIPEGFIADTLPGPQSFSDPLFRFSQRYFRTARQVVLSTEITIGVPYIEGAELDRFREMLSALNKAFLRSIILKKL